MQLVSSSLDLNDVLLEIARAAATLMQAPVCSFWLVDEATHTLELGAFSDPQMRSRFPLQRVAFEAGGIGWVAMHRQTLNVADVFADGRFLSLDWWQQENLRSFVGFPVVYEDKLLAVLALSARQRIELTADDHAVLDSFLAQAVLAIRNARMFRELQNRTEELAQANTALQREIAERKRAEMAAKTLAEETRRTRDFLQSITENSVDGMVTTDVHGQVTYFSPGAEKIFGFQADTVLGQPVSRYYDGGIEEARAIMQRLRQAGWIRNYETSMRTSSGSRVEISSSISLLHNTQGDMVGTVGVIKDITEQKRAAAEMQRAKEAAEAASRAKSEFLANMSHEIRTPMNGVIGMTELLLDTPLSAEQREYAETVRSSAEGLMTVINDVLDFSKIEAGKLPLEQLQFSMHDLLAGIMKALALRAHEKGLELVYAVDPEVPDWLLGDAGRMRQILVNLVGNAIKFTTQGEVALEITALSKVEPQGPGDDTGRLVTLSCAIRDTGIGIAAEKQRLIFEPFTQADSSTTRLYGGTGLGLAIARQLVELMGGRLWVDSVVGQGSTFSFTVCFGWQEAPLMPSRQAELAHLRNLPVLVVDDNATSRRLLEEILRRWGMQPTAVESGPAALTVMAEAAQAGTPFVLGLIDAMMPEMDGYTLAQRIKSMPTLARTALLILTSTYQARDHHHITDVGITASLGKPVSQASLWNALLAALGTPVPAAPFRPAPRATEQQQASPLRILLAEDNPVNQKLAVHMLEKHAYTVVVANNGKEVLELLAQQSFDLILMDVQMPEMCGFEATMIIREREQSTGGHLPIIAMTAHAMQGDRERCLLAGMDHYVSKPIHAKELIAAIAKVTGERCVQAAAPASPPCPPQVLFDETAALARVEGDRAILRDIAALFVADWPQSRATLRQAVLSEDAAALARIAHTLKGATATLGAMAVSAAAQRLEEVGYSGNLAPAASALIVLETEMMSALPFFTSLQQPAAQ
jgi:PAS domain S-box-containing protein